MDCNVAGMFAGQFYDHDATRAGGHVVGGHLISQLDSLVRALSEVTDALVYLTRLAGNTSVVRETILAGDLEVELE